MSFKGRFTQPHVYLRKMNLFAARRMAQRRMELDTGRQVVGFAAIQLINDKGQTRTMMVC